MPVFLLLLYYLSVEGFVSISKDEQCLDSVGGDKYGKNNWRKQLVDAAALSFLCISQGDSRE